MKFCNTYSLGKFGGLNPTPYGLFELEEKETLKYKINLFLNDFENEKIDNFFGIKEVFLKLVWFRFCKIVDKEWE